MRWYVLLSLFLLIPFVSAHGLIESIDPRPNAALLGQTDNISIAFSESIVIQATKIRLLTESGEVLPSSFYGTDDPNELLILLPQAIDETVTVSWQVLSQVDGHITEGAFVLFGEDDSYFSTATNWYDSLFFFFELLGFALLFGVYFVCRDKKLSKSISLLAAVLIIVGSGFRLFTLISFSFVFSFALLFVFLRFILGVLAVFLNKRWFFFLAGIGACLFAASSHAVANLLFPLLAFLVMAVHLFAKLSVVGLPLVASIVFLRNKRMNSWWGFWSISFWFLIVSGAIIVTSLLGSPENMLLYSWGKLALFSALLTLGFIVLVFWQKKMKRMTIFPMAVIGLFLLVTSSMVAFETPPPLFGHVDEFSVPTRVAKVSFSEPLFAPDAFLVSADFPSGSGQLDVWLENPTYEIKNLFPTLRPISESSFAFSKRVMNLPGDWYVHVRVAAPNQPASTIVFGDSISIADLRSHWISFWFVVALFVAVILATFVYLHRNLLLKKNTKSFELKTFCFSLLFCIILVFILCLSQTNFEKQCTENGHTWERSPVMFADETIGSVPVAGCTVSDRGKIYHFPNKESVMYWSSVVESRDLHSH